MEDYIKIYNFQNEDGVLDNYIKQFSNFDEIKIYNFQNKDGVLDNYIKRFNNFDKILIYNFQNEYGGLGDYLKFFMIALDECITNNIKFYCKINNIKLEKYIKLKYDFFYITSEEISKLKNVTIKTTYDYYSNGTHKYTGDILLNEVFNFDNSVKLNVKNILKILPKKYISVHLRLGDKFLEIDKSVIKCPDDIRKYSEDKMYKFIEDNNDKNILFFCDNNSYKLKIKKKYKNIIITDSNIAHTAYDNTTCKQVLDAVTEFYLLTNSETIYGSSHSGFSRMASKFNNVEYI